MSYYSDIEKENEKPKGLSPEAIAAIVVFIIAVGGCFTHSMDNQTDLFIYWLWCTLAPALVYGWAKGMRLMNGE
jgi:hypothetical protein